LLLRPEGEPWWHRRGAPERRREGWVGEGRGARRERGGREEGGRDEEKEGGRGVGEVQSDTIERITERESEREKIDRGREKERETEKETEREGNEDEQCINEKSLSTQTQKARHLLKQPPRSRIRHATHDHHALLPHNER